MNSTTFKGIVTASGREVSLENGVPCITDIALSLSRQPRFGGHTRRWWTVLDHSLFCEELADHYAEKMHLDANQARALRLAALLHDAHESLTADVPSPFKSFGLNARQATFDRRLFDSYFPGGHAAFRAFHPIVKDFDRRALRAEARLVGPMAFDSMPAVEHYFGAEPDIWDVYLLEALLEEGAIGADPADLHKGIYSPSVSAFTSLYLTLR